MNSNKNTKFLSSEFLSSTVQTISSQLTITPSTVSSPTVSPSAVGSPTVHLPTNRQSTNRQSTNRQSTSRRSTDRPPADHQSTNCQFAEQNHSYPTSMTTSQNRMRIFRLPVDFFRLFVVFDAGFRMPFRSFLQPPPRRLDDGRRRPFDPC